MDPGEATGMVVDRYHLLQKIGEGGMGEVWLAEQKEPVRRRVAVKLVKAGMSTREVMARFESERQALALMNHPAIAKVFDAGSTPQGSPYFVMEYVAGVPITNYCDEHKLNTRERLELFMRVCEAVQHAHQKAIIHRDLKPSNILVTEIDGKPTPKIIDFGVAKALTQRLTADTMFTRVGTLLGTPEYMSPEQALSSGEDIDTRSDVYSLGIVLYELLAGLPPIELRKIAFDEFLRKLREDDPPRLSAIIRTQDLATSTELARRRQTEPPALANQLRGDLDSIALKALEKDRTRRYASASEFAADIGRYLKNEAVLAVPPSFRYRARKFARRYRLPLMTACAFMLVLIAAAAISIYQSIRANKEAAVAQKETAEAQAVNDFLQNDLLAQASAANQSGPGVKRDPDLKVRTALDRAAQNITGKFDKQPEVEASIRETIGQTYMDLGLYRQAQPQFERALDLRRRIQGPGNPRTLETMLQLGESTWRQAKYSEAEALESQALQTSRRVLGPEHPDTLKAMNGLGVIYDLEGKYAQAVTLGTQTLELRRRVLGPDHPDTLRTMNNLAGAYIQQDRYGQAAELFSEILAIRRRLLGSGHPETVQAMSNLANANRGEGKLAQAEAISAEALDIQRRILGPEHPDTLRTMVNLGSLYDDQGKYAQAEALDSQILEIRRRVLGPEHPDTLVSMNNLAIVYQNEGKRELGEKQFAAVYQIRRRVLGPDHPDTIMAMHNIAMAYCDAGNFPEAESYESKVLETSRGALGPEHPLTLAILSNAAFTFQTKSKFALAEAYYSQALAARRHAFGSDNPETMDSAADLALADLSLGKFAESEPLAREALEFDRKKRPDHWQRFRAEALLGAGLAGQKKYAEAEPLLIEGYQGMAARKDNISADDRYHLDRAHEWIVQLYAAWGKPEKAAVWRKRDAAQKSEAVKH